MRRPLLLVVLFALAAGCGSSKVVPVSGRITVNGKPLPNASVTFAPIGGKGNAEPGPSSAGKTDADGRYTLALVGQSGSGAVIGRHKVQVALLSETNTADDRPDKMKQIPLKYNGQSILEYEVAAPGTESADFDLKIP